MKKLVAQLVIALAVLVGVPGIGLANTNPLTEIISENANQNPEKYRVPAFGYKIHTAYLERGEYRIILRGDGDTDLDLYVYDDTGRIGLAETPYDDESITLTVRRPGYFAVKVVNRGKVYNDYVLFYR